MSLHRYSAERFVDRDDTGEDTRLGVCDRVLGLELGALRVEQGEEVDNPFAISHAGDRGGAGALARLVGQLHEALLLLAIVDERVLGLLERRSTTCSNSASDFPSYALRAAQPCARAAKVEGRPAQRRRDRPRATVGNVEETAAPGKQPKKPVTVMRGYRSAAAAPRARSMPRDGARPRARRAGGGAVCPAPRWRAPWRAPGYGRGDRSTASSPGRTPMSTARRCWRSASALAIGGRLASMPATRAAGAGDVLLFAEPGIATHLGQPQRLSLVRQAALSDRELLLQAAQLEVVARHLRRNAHPHVVDIGLEAVGVGRGRATCERTRPKTSISQNASKPAR